MFIIFKFLVINIYIYLFNDMQSMLCRLVFNPRCAKIFTFNASDEIINGVKCVICRILEDNDHSSIAYNKLYNYRLRLVHFGSTKNSYAKS